MRIWATTSFHVNKPLKIREHESVIVLAKETNTLIIEDNIVNPGQ